MKPNSILFSWLTVHSSRAPPSLPSALKSHKNLAHLMLPMRLQLPKSLAVARPRGKIDCDIVSVSPNHPAQLKLDKVGILHRGLVSNLSFHYFRRFLPSSIHFLWNASKWGGRVGEGEAELARGKDESGTQCWQEWFRWNNIPLF